MGVVYLVEKPLGLTPLQALEEFKSSYEGDLPETLTYAGRLDPMAEGLLPIVDGKDTELKKKVATLSKVYCADILFGVSTDSGDLLGKVMEINFRAIEQKNVEKIGNKVLGVHEYEIPRFSSPIIAKHDLDEIEETLPLRKQMNVISVNYLSSRVVSQKDILERLEGAEKKLSGDFRHSEIQKTWKNVFLDQTIFTLHSFEFEVESGAYIRSIASYMGGLLNLPTCLFSLKRIKVGEWIKPGIFFS